jgi:hypothetical protein
MQRYLRPDLLHDAGISDFDTWAATFGQTVTQIELAPEGGSFRQKTRFAKFRNVPEMLRMWHVSADIKTGEDLKLPTPELAPRDADHQRAPETVIVQPSDALLAYVAELGERAEKIRSRAVSPEEDNMLKVSGDGRKAALDMRLAGQPMTTPGKIDAAALRIAALWREHRDRIYPSPGGTPHPVRGSLQLVFCDLGTPSSGWNAYDELRDQLTARGLPRTAIRFVHEAKTDRDKGELFAACRAGTVAVLIGSTEKMGVGTNVQTRAIALHHLDCPWRPADVAQREGRILRQGNLNPEVQILRYVTERSFDGYMWQTVERKARFIAQVMRGRLDVREIADIGDAALSYTEVKALATGNPLLLEKAEADAELTRLQRAERAHHRNQDSLRHTITQAEQRIGALTALIVDIDTAISRRRDTRGDAFTMTAGGIRYTKRHDAGQRLIQTVQQELARLATSSHQQYQVRPAQLGGFEVTATVQRTLGTTEAVLALDGAPGTDLRLAPKDLADADPARLIMRLENRLAGLETLKTKTQTEAERLRAETAHAAADLGKPFPQATQLTAVRDRAAQIDQKLKQAAMPPRPANGHDPLLAAAMRDAMSSARRRSATIGPVSADEIRSSANPAAEDMAGSAEHLPSGPIHASPPSDDQASGPTISSPAQIAAASFPERNPLARPSAPIQSAQVKHADQPRPKARPSR